MTQGRRRSTLAGAARRWRAVGGFFRGPRLRRYGPVLAVVGLALVVIAALAVAPVTTYFRQQDQTRQAEAELEQLEAEVEALDARLGQLRTDDEVERIARENYDLVFPGEESYRILPAPEPGAPPADGAVPDAFPPEATEGGDSTSP